MKWDDVSVIVTRLCPSLVDFLPESCSYTIIEFDYGPVQRGIRVEWRKNIQSRPRILLVFIRWIPLTPQRDLQACCVQSPWS